MIDIKTKVISLAQEKADIPPDAMEVLFDMGLLELHVCKKVLIREEYNQKAFTHKKTDLKIALSEKYCVSLSTVEKYLQEKSCP